MDFFMDSISECLGDCTSRSPLLLASHGIHMEYSFGKYLLNLAIRYLTKAVSLRINFRILQLYKYMHFMKKSNNSFLALKYSCMNPLKKIKVAYITISSSNLQYHICIITPWDHPINDEKDHDNEKA